MQLKSELSQPYNYSYNYQQINKQYTFDQNYPPHQSISDFRYFQSNWNQANRGEFYNKK